LDGFAVIAHLRDESGAADVGQLLSEAGFADRVSSDLHGVRGSGGRF
jgi:hypothetical protein